MRALIALILASFVTIALVVHDRPGARPSRSPVYQELSPETQRLVEGNTEFALDLYKRVAAGPGDKFFSPYNVSTALGMAHAGANGATAAQISTALRFPLEGEPLHAAFGQLQREMTERDRVRLKFANALWVDESCELRDPYTDLVSTCYGAAVQSAKFTTALDAEQRRINEWVEERTEGMITNLLESLSPDTRVVLTTVVCFKGLWGKKFDPRATLVDQTFTRADGTLAKVSLMSQTKAFLYGEGEGYEVLRLPYEDYRTSMLVILPSKPDGLPEIEARLSPAFLKSVLASLQPREVTVFLPRFELECKLELAGELRAMGMVDAFGESADFSGMASGVILSSVFHKAKIEVDEEGTEAAAATAVGAVCGSPEPEPPAVFRADRPFMFLIRDERTGSILFMGRYGGP